MKLATIWVADAPERLVWVKHFIERLPYRWITDCLGETREPDEAVDLIVISDERYFPWMPERIAQWRAEGIPVLHIADGICEWRNMFDNPTYDRAGEPAPLLYQPVWADKIACLGPAQARILESLGNAGRPEIVGLPRLDDVVPLPPRGISPQERKICVTSARVPAFTPPQKRQFMRALMDLKEWFSRVGAVLPHPIVPLWRLPQDYADKLGLPNTSYDMSGGTILQSLRECMALVTTPSTVVLEGMLLGLPCALLDYYQTPLYIDAGWRVSNLQQLHDALLEMIESPARRLDFQSYVLHDHLACRTPALPRLQRLIDTMIELGRDARAIQTSPRFPRRILSEEVEG